ncbi:MAG TPA: hypothetical protein VKA46_36290 [Gemmataceae bacterium]|nr:hypothetical protein [Gemmataceae bacterium]
MPPRYVILAIVAFWLVTVGLFLHGVVMPRLAQTEPVMFPVDLVDEAGKQTETTSFEVTKNGTGKSSPLYRADVDWRYHPEDDTFESECTLNLRFVDEPEPPRNEGPAWLPQVHRVDMTSSYRLTRYGEMTAINSQTSYHLVMGEAKEGIKVEAEVTGAPRAGQYTPHLRFTIPGLGDERKIGPLTLRDFERDGDPVAVLDRGTVLNPLHPPRRFPGLRDGQSWRLTVIDPLALVGLVASLDAAKGDALREAGVAAGAYGLDAHVMPDTETVTLQGGNEVACRVIRCTGDGPVSALAFWVRQGDGAVMKQEVNLHGDSWSLLRLPFGYKMRSSPRPRITP